MSLPEPLKQKERTSGGRFVVLAFFFNERDFEIVITISNEFFSPAWVPIFLIPASRKIGT